MRIRLIFGLLLMSSFLLAQYPNTDIYLFTLGKDKEGVYRLTEPKYLTNFNPNGYNAHPHFISSNELYISVLDPTMDTIQTDIYSLNLSNNVRTQITGTLESEHGPQAVPGYSYFSAIRAEADVDRTQRLWQFPLDRRDQGRPVFPYLRNIENHFWIGRNYVALYLTTNPSELILAKVSDGSTQEVAKNVGSCLQRLKNGNLAFVKKEADQWVICELDLFSRPFDYQEIVPTLEGVEQFAVLPDGSLLMGRGSKLYRNDISQEEKIWEELVDLRYYNIHSIKSMTISTDGKLAMVTQ
ncbi:MAG: hypothetical protein AAGH79_07605 [Bacteroidota bacterium]